MNFEESMNRLNAISSEMSSDGISLEKSLELYKEAVILVKSCREYLENAKLTIEQLETVNEA